MGRALEELERPKAKERQSEAGRTRGAGKTASGKFTEAVSETTREKVGAAVGMSGAYLASSIPHFEELIFGRRRDSTQAVGARLTEFRS